MNEDGSGLCTFLRLRDNWDDFSEVDGLSIETSGKIGPLPLSKHSKDVNIKTVNLSLTDNLLDTPSLYSMSNKSIVHD